MRVILLTTINIVWACLFIPGSSFSQIDIPKFTDVSAEAGLTQLTNTMSYAAAAADFNQDGFPDIAISTHGGITLLKNQGNGKFLDVSDILGFKEGDTHGISWIDMNDDGLPDLAVSCGADRGRGEGANQFYLNRGGEKFERIASPDPIIADKLGRGRSITPADLNNDGAIDLIISNLYQPGRPHRIALALGRQHPLQFRDIAPASGIAGLQSFGVITADLNNDYHTYLIANGPGTESGSVLLQEKNAFINVTQKIGLAEDSILSVVPFDYDNDGDLDLLCIKRQFAGPSGSGLLNGKIYFDLSSHQIIQGFKSPIQDDTIVADIRFEGRKRDPHLLHLGKNKIPANRLPWEGRSDTQILQGEPQLNPKQDTGGFLWQDSFGFLNYHFIGDSDRLQSTSGIIQSQSFGFSSLEKINLAHHQPILHTNSLYENNKGFFHDVADKAGILGNGLGYNAITADFNNDGFMDIYVVNAGHEFEHTNPHNSLFVNNGNSTFVEVAQEAGAEGPSAGVGNGTIALDYDQDGDIDLFIYNGNVVRPMPPGPFTLLRNDSKDAGQSIQVNLQGTSSNKRGWGVKINSVTGTSTLYQQNNGGNGHLSTSDLPTHIGIKNFNKSSFITVSWPSGKKETLTAIPAGSKLVLKE